MKPSFKLLASLALVGLLASCGGGGGSNSADAPPVASTLPPPPPPVAVLAAPTGLAMSYTIKTFNLSWSASEKATGYQVFEDPNGTSGFTQVGATTTGTTATVSVGGLLHTRLNAKYAVRACNASGCSANSVAITPDLTQAVGYFKASNTQGSDAFGSSVALSADGNTLAVGANGEDSNAIGIGGNQSDNSVFDAGAVYIFARIGGVWHQQAYVKASDTMRQLTFGAFTARPRFGRALALSADGNTLAVGASFEITSSFWFSGDPPRLGSDLTGAVYVFSRSDTTWAQQAYVKAFTNGEYHHFAKSVALSGDGNTLAVGAIREPTNLIVIGGNQPGTCAQNCGEVYVFTRSGAVWAQQAQLKASNTEADDSFGLSVALSNDGNTLAVGAAEESSNATGIGGDQANNSAARSGAVYVFARADSVWTQQAYVKASNTQAQDSFGGRVALSNDGNTLAVGATGESSNTTGIGGNQADNSAARSGAVYVFARSGGVWTQQAYVKASNTEANDGFGASVAMSGDGNTLAVGAVFESSNATGIGGNQADNGVPRAGAVYVFTRGSMQWVQQAYVKATNTRKGRPPEFFSDQFNFGQGIALSGDGKTLAVGADGEDSNATGIGGNQADNSASFAGAVYLY